MKKILVLSIAGFLLFVLAFSSCKKEKATVSPADVYSTGIDARINDLICLNDSVWLAVGGQRDESGYFLRSEDAGKSWSVQPAGFPRSVYSIARTEDNLLWAGGDYLFLWKSEDDGKTWIYQWLGDQVPYHEEDRPAIRDILQTDDSLIVFCGGENLGEGLVYTSSDNGHSWDFVFRQHEYRCLSDLSDGRIFAGGHGEAASLRDSVGTFSSLIFPGEFLVSSLVLGEEILLLTSDGEVFRVKKNLVDWEKDIQSSIRIGRRTTWMQMAALGEIILAVGFDGALALSGDGGKSWKEMRAEGEADFLSVQVCSDYFLCTTTDGRIFKFVF